MTHESHQTRYSDSSIYDEICVKCGATDSKLDLLEKPCPGPHKLKIISFETFEGRNISEIHKFWTKMCNQYSEYSDLQLKVTYLKGMPKWYWLMGRGIKPEYQDVFNKDDKNW